MKYRKRNYCYTSRYLFNVVSGLPGGVNENSLSINITGKLPCYQIGNAPGNRTFLPPAYVVRQEGNVLTRVCPSIHQSVCPQGGESVSRLSQGGGVSPVVGGGQSSRLGGSVQLGGVGQSSWGRGSVQWGGSVQPGWGWVSPAGRGGQSSNRTE